MLRVALNGVAVVAQDMHNPRACGFYVQEPFLQNGAPVYRTCGRRHQLDSRNADGFLNACMRETGVNESPAPMGCACTSVSKPTQAEAELCAPCRRSADLRRGARAAGRTGGVCRGLTQRS